MTDPIELLPRPRLRLRAGLFAVLAIFGLIGGAAWWAKLFWLVGMAFFCGSFREARINGENFERRQTLFFVPQPWKSWPLDRFRGIEIVVDEGWMGHSFLPAAFNVVFILWSRFFDYLIPWFGGTYKLRLKPEKGPRVLVWQGNSEYNFDVNLDLLEEATGFKSHRKK